MNQDITRPRYVGSPVSGLASPLECSNEKNGASNGALKDELPVVLRNTIKILCSVNRKWVVLEKRGAEEAHLLL